MPSNFCFHVYAQIWVFIGGNGNSFLDLLLFIITLSSDNTNSRAGSQLKMSNFVLQPLGTLIKLSAWNFEIFNFEMQSLGHG